MPLINKNTNVADNGGGTKYSNGVTKANTKVQSRAAGNKTDLFPKITPKTNNTQTRVNAPQKTVFDYLKSYGSNSQGASATTAANLYGSNYSGANATSINTSNPTGENRYKNTIQNIDKSLGSPVQNTFKMTNKLLESASDYLDQSNQMTDIQKHHLDVSFSGYVDTGPVYSKIKNDRTYASKLADEQGNLIDYTDQITKLESQIDSTANPYERKELKQQLDLCKEYQADQKKLQYASYYDFLQKNGASEEDLIAFKKDVIRNNYSGIERTLANFTSTVQSHIGNTIKGYETLYATASNLFGEEYKMSEYVDKVIDDAELLRQYSMQGANGMEKLVYEVYDGMAPFLYSVMTAQFMGGDTSYLGNEEAAKVLNNRALLMSDVSTLGSKMKQNLDNGYDFNTSFNNAFFSAALSHTTEAIGGESLANILTGKIGEELMENTLSYTIRALSNQFASEAIEEGAEALIEPIIDKYTLNTGMTVEDYMNQVLSKDTVHSMMVGGLGGLVMGAFGTMQAVGEFNTIADSIPMKSKADYNAAIEARNKLQEIVRKAELSNGNTEIDEQQIRNSKLLIAAFNKKINNYAAANPYMDAFVSESDSPKVNLDADPRSTILEAAAPDFTTKLDEIVQEKNEIGEQSQRAVETMQESLNNEGINASAIDMISMSEEAMDTARAINRLAKSTDRNVAFANLVSKSGEVIDGLYDSKSGRTLINPNGKNSLISTLIHEFTHGTESSKYYSLLHNFVKEYLANDYQTAIENIKDEYSTVQSLDDEGATHELVAITTQELLGNEEFVDRLVRYDTSLAYRMYEEIRYANEYTGGALEGIEQNFMRAFADQETSLNNEIQYSVGLGSMRDNNEILVPYSNEDVNKVHRAKNRLVVDVDISLDDFIQMAMEKTNGQTDYVLRLGKLPDYFIERVWNETGVDIGKRSLALPISGIRHSMEHSYEGKLHKGEIPIIRNEFHKLADIITSSDHITYKEEYDKKNHLIKKLVFDTDTDSNFAYKTVEVVVNNGFELSILDMYKDKKKKFISTANGTNVSPASTSYNDMSPTSINNISNINDEVKSEMTELSKGLSLNDLGKTDAHGQTLSNRQIEYFKNTKIVDENGNPIPVYHGSPTTGITQFESRPFGNTQTGDYGIFFTNDPEFADDFAYERIPTDSMFFDKKGEKGQVYEAYLNMTNPLDFRTLSRSDLEALYPYMNDYAKQIYPDQESFVNDMLHFQEVGNHQLMKANLDLRSVSENTAYDGLIANLDPNDLSKQEYAVWSPEQIKSTDNAYPTADPDIRFSKGNNLDSVIGDARKDLRSIGEKNRRVNLTETLEKAVTDIREDGDISQDVYSELRKKVIESTVSKMPNEAYGLAQDIRDMIGNRFGRLKKDGWDIQLQEINDTYHLYDENEVGINTWQDAQNFLDDYLSSLGGKYIYADPVEMGYMSQEDYDNMVDEKLDEVITNLKDSINNENVVENVADMLSNDDIEENMYRQGQENLGALLNEENDLLKRIEDASVGNMTSEQLDALEQESLQDISIEEAKAQVSPILKEAAKTKKPLRTMKDMFYQVRQKMFDKGIAIRDMKNRQLSVSYDMMLNADNMANRTIMNGVYDSKGKKVADGLTEISKMIPESQKNDFDYYMYHKHNIDAAKIGKPVFMNFDYGKSQQIVNQYEMQYPEWPKVAQKYYDLNDQMLNRQVQSGVISQDMADHWKELYPHYVPTKRVLGEVEDANVAETADPQVTSANKGTLYERTGGTSPIQPLDYAMAEHIKQIYKSSLFNNFARDYVKASHSQTTVFNEQQYIEDMVEANEDMVTKADEYTPATMVWYNGGERNIVEIPQNIYDAVKPSETPFNLPSSIPFLSWATKLRTNMITGANPVFWATNAVKDFQDVAFNSKYAKDTYLNLPRAYKQLLTNGDIANLYKSMGGEYQTYSSEAGVKQNDHGKFYNATIGNFVKFNELVEMAPRLAEFMSSLDHGDSVETAMYNAAEVTTNFKRGGDYAKWINRNGVNFFNASIQGFDKQIRNIEDAYDSKGWKGVVGYMAKSSLISGIPLVVLNGLLHKDDKDYEELSDYIKDNYYVLWKYDDGKFVRIPKGRIANAYQGIMSALYKDGVELSSDDDAMSKAQNVWDNTLDGFLNVWEQIGINNPIGNNIFAPISQTIKNEAWYGDPIVSTYMQKKDIADQYDESTDLLSVWLGQKTNVSPMKINYLIDQYSGGAGDFILPYLTPKAETGLRDGTPIGEVASFFISPYADKFTTDSVFKNQKVTDFFTLDEELTKMAQKEHASDEAILSSKYINSIQYQMNDLYAAKREVQKDTTLTDAQKYEKARTIQEQINELARTGLDTYDQIDMESYYGSVGGMSYQKKNGEWVKVDADKEQLLNDMGATTKEKSDYFYTVNTISGIRKDIKDETPEGEKAEYKEATINAIETSGLNAKMQNYLYDSYYSGKLTDNVNSMEISDEDKLAIKIASSKGVAAKDANGKTISNSKALSTADAYADAGVLDDVFDYIRQNGLEPSDFGLTKTVYNYSYDNMVKAYQSVFGQQFGTGETTQEEIGTINASYTAKSSGSKSGTKSSSRSSRSSSKRAKAQIQEEARIKKLKKALLAFLKANRSSTDISDVLKKSTRLSDVEANVQKILRNL